MDAAEPLIVNRSELAELLNVSLPTIDAYVSRGMPKLGDGKNGVAYRFDAAECIAWSKGEELREREAEERRQHGLNQLRLELSGGRNADDGQPVDPKKRKEALEAAFLADKLDQARKRLYPAEEVAADFSAVFSLFRQTVLNDAAGLSRLLGLTPEQTAKLADNRRDLLNQLAGQISILELRAVILDLLNAAA